MRGADSVEEDLGASGEETAKGAMDAKDDEAKEVVLASPAEPAADGVAEMRRMVGTGCEGDSDDGGMGDVARDGAWGRDKRGIVLRIF